MANEIDQQKIIANIHNLLNKATGKQLRIIFLIVYEIVRR